VPGGILAQTKRDFTLRGLLSVFDLRQRIHVSGPAGWGCRGGWHGRATCMARNPPAG
jgi:hypothetical protein